MVGKYFNQMENSDNNSCLYSLWWKQNMITLFIQYQTKKKINPEFFFITLRFFWFSLSDKEFRTKISDAAYMG